MKLVTVIGDVELSPLLDGRTLPRCGVIRAPRLTELNAEDAVLVACAGAVIPERLSVLAAVVDLDSAPDLSGLSGVSVITCGLGSRNTVSITSKTEEFVTLSLNRSIHTLKGLCEPLELPLPVLGGMEDFGYMAAFAASLLLGNIG